MSERHITGKTGESEIVASVRCPNCRSPLVALPPSFPLLDVQCTRCLFRAQVKTATSPPKGSVLGSGWDIMSKVLKAGHLPPPLLVLFRWPKPTFENRVIRFYPFVPVVNLRPYTLAPTAQRANYKMFTYEGLDKLPHFTLHDSRS